MGDRKKGSSVLGVEIEDLGKEVEGFCGGSSDEVMWSFGWATEK